MENTYNAQTGLRVPSAANYFAPSAAPAPSGSAVGATHANGPSSGPVNIFNDMRLASGEPMQARAAPRLAVATGDAMPMQSAPVAGVLPTAPTMFGARS